MKQKTNLCSLFLLLAVLSTASLTFALPIDTKASSHTNWDLQFLAGQYDNVTSSYAFLTDFLTEPTCHLSVNKTTLCQVLNALNNACPNVGKDNTTKVLLDGDTTLWVAHIPLIGLLPSYKVKVSCDPVSPVINVYVPTQRYKGVSAMGTNFDFDFQIAKLN